MLILLALIAAAENAAPQQPASTVAGMQPVPGVPSLVQSGIPPVPRDLMARLNQYLNARSAKVLDVSDDGAQLLIGTRFASTQQLHVVDAPLGMRTQVTFGEEPILSARFQPGDPQILWYLQDKGGGEFYQVFRLDRRTGRSELITDGKSRHEDLLISRDGRRIAWTGTGRNGKDTDVYVADVSSPKTARRLTERDGTWGPVDFSPDGTRLLVQQFRSAQDVDLHVADLGTGELRQITPQGKASLEAARFAADGKSVFLVTDRWGDFNSLYRLDLSRPGDKPQQVQVGGRWDVEDVEVAPDGSRLAVAVNEDGISRLYLVDGRSGKAQPVALPKTAVMASMRFAQRRPGILALSFQTATQPTDSYVLDVATGKVVRWTRSEVGGLDPSTFVDAQLVRYPSTDGIQVPAFLYKPRRASGKLPVVIIWHGGPEGQSRPTFSNVAQMLATDIGIAVLMPNVRGSLGYGKAYLAADDGMKREGALADIGATLDFIAAQPDLDPSRVAAYGGSYGGYMTLATAAFQGKRVRAAVDSVGISNLVTFLQNTQAYRRDLRRAEYGDERDPQIRAMQERISPLNSVEKIEAELFVQQGQNDPRVPQSESEQIVQAVRKRGKDVWYLLGLNEGHGFQKKENKDYATAAIVLFLQQKLVSQPVPNN